MASERDPRLVVAAIQRLLAAGGDVEKVKVRQLADEYAGWMGHAMDRLGRCGVYLSLGRTTEAVYQSDLDPPLLTWLGCLFFAEREQWAAVVDNMGAAMPRPGQDVDGVVGGINDAYITEQRLREEKKAFRRMVLQNAPYGTRLVQARRLLGLAPASTALKENVRDLEREEQRELLERARRSKLASELAEVHNQMVRTPWVEPVGEAMRREVDALYGRVRGAHLQNEQTRLNRKLVEARKRHDIDELMNLRPDWDRLSAEMGLAPGDPRAHSAARIFAWVDQQIAGTEAELGYINALDDLQSAMARGAPETELWELYYKLEAFGKRVPVEVEQRFQGHVDRLDNRRKQRELMVVVGVVSVGATVLVAFLVWLLNRGG